MIEFLKVNILVINYIMKEITRDELEEVLKEVLSREDIEEKFVRDYLNFHTIDHSNMSDMDKVNFIYKFGSKKAKRITVDEKLKMI